MLLKYEIASRFTLSNMHKYKRLLKEIIFIHFHLNKIRGSVFHIVRLIFFGNHVNCLFSLVAEIKYLHPFKIQNMIFL